MAEIAEPGPGEMEWRAGGWHDEDAPRIEPAAGGPADGAYAAIAPDPERDARRDAYRERERRRAARALDRYIDLMWVPERAAGDPAAEQAAMFAAGERFVEAVGDYVLSRLAESSDRDVEFGLQQKSHYGASDHEGEQHPDE